jgi:hypothetical protein
MWTRAPFNTFGMVTWNRAEPGNSGTIIKKMRREELTSDAPVRYLVPAMKSFPLCQAQCTQRWVIHQCVVPECLCTSSHIKMPNFITYRYLLLIYRCWWAKATFIFTVIKVPIQYAVSPLGYCFMQTPFFFVKKYGFIFIFFNPNIITLFSSGSQFFKRFLRFQKISHLKEIPYRAELPISYHQLQSNKRQKEILRLISFSH